MSARPFEIVCEIEPPVRPDLTHARHQIGVLTAVSGTFLIPDNHIGRATVSSIAVAHEVQAMGGRSIAASTPATATCSASAVTCSPPPPTASASSCSSTATSRARAGGPAS